MNIDPVPWMNRFRDVHLVAQVRGMITLTSAGDTYTIWIYDYPIASGSSDAMRDRFKTFIMEWHPWL